MNPDFLFALYVFCSDYHSGQGNRLYRLLSRLSGGRYRVKLSDNAMQEIRQGEGMNWYWAGEYYKELVEKYGTQEDRIARLRGDLHAKST